MFHVDEEAVYQHEESPLLRDNRYSLNPSSSSASKMKTSSLPVTCTLAMLLIITLFTYVHLHRDVNSSSIPTVGHMAVILPSPTPDDLPIKYMGNICTLNTPEELDSVCEGGIFLYFRTPATKLGQWPLGFSWTLTEDLTSENMKHTILVEKGPEQMMDSSCTSFSRAMCLHGSYILYANIDSADAGFEVYNPDLHVDICSTSNRVFAGEAFDFDTNVLSCTTDGETPISNPSPSNHLRTAEFYASMSLAPLFPMPERNSSLSPGNISTIVEIPGPIMGEPKSIDGNIDEVIKISNIDERVYSQMLGNEAVAGEETEMLETLLNTTDPDAPMNSTDAEVLLAEEFTVAKNLHNIVKDNEKQAATLLVDIRQIENDGKAVLQLTGDEPNHEANLMAEIFDPTPVSDADEPEVPVQLKTPLTPQQQFYYDHFAKAVPATVPVTTDATVSVKELTAAQKFYYDHFAPKTTATGAVQPLQSEAATATDSNLIRGVPTVLMI